MTSSELPPGTQVDESDESQLIRQVGRYWFIDWFYYGNLGVRRLEVSQWSSSYCIRTTTGEGIYVFHPLRSLSLSLSLSLYLSLSLSLSFSLCWLPTNVLSFQAVLFENTDLLGDLLTEHKDAARKVDRYASEWGYIRKDLVICSIRRLRFSLRSRFRYVSECEYICSSWVVFYGSSVLVGKFDVRYVQ